MSKKIRLTPGTVWFQLPLPFQQVARPKPTVDHECPQCGAWACYQVRRKKTVLYNCLDGHTWAHRVTEKTADSVAVVEGIRADL